MAAVVGALEHGEQISLTIRREFDNAPAAPRPVGDGRVRVVEALAVALIEHVDADDGQDPDRLATRIANLDDFWDSELRPLLDRLAEELLRAEETAAHLGAEARRSGGYSLVEYRWDARLCGVELDGNELFDVVLHDDDEGKSLTGLARMVALAMTPEQARAVRDLMRRLDDRGYDDVDTGPLAELYQRLRESSAL